MRKPMEKTAVLLVDFINDFHFDRGDHLVRHTAEIIPHVLALKTFARENLIPVIYINDHYGLWEGSPDQLIDHCSNDRSKDIIRAIRPDNEDYFLIKPQLSAFYQTPLASLLDELGVTNLILSGIAGDICILFTAKDAYMYDYNLHIPEDCVASNEKQGNGYALYLMRSVMKANTEPICRNKQSDDY